MMVPLYPGWPFTIFPDHFGSSRSAKLFGASSGFTSRVL